MKIDKKNKMCSYNDDEHIYWLNDNPKDKCISVTTLISKYKTPFDEEFWSSYKTLEALYPEIHKLEKGGLLKSKKFNKSIFEKYNINIKHFNKHKEEVKISYKITRDESCKRGSNIHKILEDEYYKKPTHNFKKHNLKLNDEFKCIKDYYELDLDCGVYPEFLVYYVSEDNELKLAGQIDLLIKHHNDIYVIDYKGLPLDTPIATQEGWKKLEELTLKDKIFDKDGNLTNIKNISEIHNNPCYQINFDNGESIVADHEHRWIISFRRSKGNYVEKVMTTKDIAKFLENKPRTSYNIPKIMNSKPLNLPDVKLPIDPYIFGAWLGDGSKSCGIITNINENFWKEVSNRGYQFGKNVSSENGSEMHTILNIRKDLRKLNVLYNKHIPDIYFRASYNQRLDLLKGLMDTDGYYNSSRKRFVMTTTQYWQAKDTAKLVATLGWKPTIISATKYCNEKKFQGWDVCFTTNGENPFLIRNQSNTEYPKVDKNSFRNIISVEIVPTVQTKCLEVDSPSHTFLAGHTLIPTHNSNRELKFKSYYDPFKKSNQMMNYPMNNLMDCNMVHYQLQLSLYAWMIKQINPEFNIKLLRIIHYDHDNQITEYDLDYLETDINKLLKHYKQKKEIDDKVDKLRSINY